MFIEFKTADETGSRVSVNVSAIAGFVAADDSTTRITLVGGVDLWVAEQYEKVMQKVVGR